MESEFEFIERLQRISVFDVNRSYPALFQYIGYRQRIAQELLFEKDEKKKHDLIDLFESVNNQIKLIIVL